MWTCSIRIFILFETMQLEICTARIFFFCMCIYSCVESYKLKCIIEKHSLIQRNKLLKDWLGDFILMRESTVEHGTPPEESISVQDHHSACYQVLPHSDDVAKHFEEVITCCESLHTLTLQSAVSQEELLVLLKDKCCQCAWGVAPMGAEYLQSSEVWVWESKDFAGPASREAKRDWLGFAFFILPSVMPGIHNWWCLSAILGGGKASRWSPTLPSLVCDPKGSSQPYHLPSPGGPSPFGLRVWVAW